MVHHGGSKVNAMAAELSDLLAAVAELKELRRFLMNERSALKSKITNLVKENNQLKLNTRSLCSYIKELEMFVPDESKINLEELRDKLYK